MRKSNFLVMLGALAGVMMLGACSVNDDITDNTDDGAVHFTAGIAQVATPQGAPVTKAAGTTWGSGDAIGIFMVGNGGTTNVIETNKEYTTTGSSTFTATTGNEIFYPMDGSKVDFIAYYPYESSVTAIDNTIDVNVSGTQTTASQAGIDLLWAKADNSTAGYDKETNKTTP